MRAACFARGVENQMWKWMMLAVALLSTVATVFAQLETSATRSGPHAYFSNLIARADFWTGLSFRPIAGQACKTTVARGCGNVYYENQLKNHPGSRGLFGYEGAPFDGVDFRYDYASDTDPHKQDATKVTISPWSQTFASLRMPESVSASRTSASCTEYITIGTGKSSTYGNPRDFKLDSEVLRNCDPDGSAGPLPTYDRATTGRMYVLRGQRGTTAAAHDVGAYLRLATSSTASQIRFPLNPGGTGGSEDGYTYLITWDGYWTDSFLTKGNLDNHKAFQISSKSPDGNASGSIWIETWTNFSNSGMRAKCFNTKEHVASVGTRAYLGVPNDNATWTRSDGQRVGPGTTGKEPLAPVNNDFCIHPNRWARFWYRIQQVVGDWEIIDVWVADEQQNPVKVTDNLKITLPGGAASPEVMKAWWAEFNTSDDFANKGSSDTPWVAYIRNLSVHRSAGVAADGSLSNAAMASTFLVKPLPD